MRLDLFVKFKYQSNNKYYPFVLNILCVTYFLTSITMHDPQTSDMCRVGETQTVGVGVRVMCAIDDVGASRPF